MPSYPFGKNEAVNWIRKTMPQGATALDVGANNGVWSILLNGYLKLDGLEVFEPYIRKYDLPRLYDSLFLTNITDFKYEHYDLVIFGDVIEHLCVHEAQEALSYAEKRADYLLVSVPFRYQQGPVNGNDHEIHIQDDLTMDLFNERYPGFEVLAHFPQNNYCYFVKRCKND